MDGTVLSKNNELNCQSNKDDILIYEIPIV